VSARARRLAEELRGDIMSEILAMALACDLTRVASFAVTQPDKSYLDLRTILGVETDIHEMSHGRPGLAAGVSWIVKQWGKLIVKLKAIPEIEGGTMLDNTILMIAFEGGFGRDDEGGGVPSSHSTEDMVVLIAGGRNAGLKPGQHVVAKGKHPAQVLISGMTAAGVPGERLGQITGKIDALFA
jgi:hypothetical protein